MQRTLRSRARSLAWVSPRRCSPPGAVVYFTIALLAAACGDGAAAATRVGAMGPERAAHRDARGHGPTARARSDLDYVYDPFVSDGARRRLASARRPLHDAARRRRRGVHGDQERRLLERTRTPPRRGGSSGSTWDRRRVRAPMAGELGLEGGRRERRLLGARLPRRHRQRPSVCTRREGDDPEARRVEPVPSSRASFPTPAGTRTRTSRAPSPPTRPAVSTSRSCACRRRDRRSRAPRARSPARTPPPTAGPPRRPPSSTAATQSIRSSSGSTPHDAAKVVSLSSLVPDAPRGVGPLPDELHATTSCPGRRAPARRRPSPRAAPSAPRSTPHPPSPPTGPSTSSRGRTSTAATRTSSRSTRT